MAADYSRIHRLLKILTLIQGESGWTAKRLSLECGTTQRTIYRDLKMLEAAGIPYFYDEQSGGYAVRRDFFMPAVSLTLEESLALVALAEHIGGREQVPFTRAAAKAISKIRCSLPQGIQAELQKLDPHVAIQLAAANPPESSADVYDVVRTAIATRRTLRCQYESLSHEKEGTIADELFTFAPYTLFFSQRAWYAVGRHSARRAVRCLKLSRFTRCQLTDDRYEIPADFSLARHLGNAWRMIRGDKSYRVELEFDREFAETIADTRWHATQEIIWNEDASISFHCTVDGLDEIVWWVLSMGPHCRVKKPKELAHRVRRLAEEMLRLYAQEPESRESRPVLTIARESTSCAASADLIAMS